jgi:hypothetical protein
MGKLLLAIFSFIVISAPANAQIDTNTVVYSWMLDESYANRIRVNVDTLLDNFQNYNPIFRQYTAVQTLGNYSLPALSAIYTERPLNNEFFPGNTFTIFMKTYENTRYINSRKPFSRLTYIKGGSNQTKEEMLDAYHSQNLTKTLNFGLHYTTIGALGQYSFQRVKNNSFRFFSSLAGRIYSYHVSINYNKIVADENGGVANDSLITDSTFVRSKDIPTLFGGTENSINHEPDVYNTIKNLNVLAIQEIAFRSRPESRDSASVVRRTRIFYPKLVYLFSLNRTSKQFIDKNPQIGLQNGLYPETYVSDELTSDSLVYWKMSNALRMQFQGRRNNHYFVDYSYELMNYSMSTRSPAGTIDTFSYINEPFNLPRINNSNRLFNSYISSGFSKIFAERIDMNLYGKLYIAGYRTGDLNISGNMKLIFGKAEKPFTFYASAEIQSRTPDYLYTRYLSNNFIWTRNFARTTINHLSTNLSLSSKKFDIQGDYYLLSNVIYLNNNAFPAQYKNVLSILVLSAAKQFDFWKMTSINKLVYQESENESIIDLPELAFYNSTYFKHLINFKATGGKLLFMLGFDFFYNTKYYADAYMPALNSFYRQNEKQLGGYPYIDVFLNLQLKRFRFFVKVEHVNSGWSNQNYFSVLHYPRNGRDLKFGLSWTFYD